MSLNFMRMGMVFYAPSGETIESEGKTFREGHSIYGYAPNGKLYRKGYDSENSDLIVVREDLPDAPDYKPPAENPLLALAPAYARKGNVWMLAPNAQVLKQALSAQPAQQLTRWIDATGSRDAESLFYLDPKRAASTLKGMLGKEVDADPELKQVFGQADAWLAPWRAVFGMARTLPERSTQSRLILAVDLDKVKPGSLAGAVTTFVTNFTKAQQSAKVTSVKANMHTFQTIVETYAVDWGGVYAPDVATIKKEAVIAGREYWKDVINPYLGEGALTYRDFKDYKPGPEAAGQVFYDPQTGEDGQIVQYWIYGTDGAGQLIQYKGQNFTLTNS